MYGKINVAVDYIKLVGGLILLILSGDYLVRGGVAIATRLKVSPLVIGMTVIAFGTSAPEFLVSLQAAIKGNSEIAIGNVVGSNIANIALILGMTALVYPLKVAKNSLRFDWPVMMIATLLFTWAAAGSIITRIEGIIGAIALIGYTIWQIWYSRKNHIHEEEEVVVKPVPIWLSLLFIAGSCIGLAYGADFLIEGASSIAQSYGISERVIGVTIVAFGTSLPELAASLSAAFKKQTDIAIGNIIGSNLFNILSVIGLTAAIRPIPVDWTNFRPDFIWMCGISLLLIFLLLPVREAFSLYGEPLRIKLKALFMGGRLGRWGGILFVLIYIFYIYTLLIHG